MIELRVPSRIAVNIHKNTINKFDIADHCKKTRNKWKLTMKIITAKQ